MGSEFGHALPLHLSHLAAAAQNAVPQPGDLKPERLEPRAIAWHAVIAHVSDHHRAQVYPLLRNGSVHAFSQLFLHSAQLGACLLGTGQSEHHELASARGAAAMREAQEVKRLWFALPPAASVLAREAPELDEPRLLLVQRQPKALQPCSHVAPEAPPASE